MPNAMLRSPASDTFVTLPSFLGASAVVTRPGLYRTVKTYVGKRDHRQFDIFWRRGMRLNIEALVTAASFARNIFLGIIRRSHG